MKTAEKVLTVDGMSCGHCKAWVEKALAAVPGVRAAQVDLSAGTATVILDSEVSDDELKKAVEDAGYEVPSIENR